MGQLLVGVDGSQQSVEAAKVAVGLAQRLGAQVVLAYVVPPDVAVVPGFPLLPGYVDTEAAQREHFASATALLEDCAEDLAVPGVPLTTRVIAGNPAAGLAALARAPEVELVVIGGRGSNPIERALLGSVASRLTRTCTKPVLVLPPAATQAARLGPRGVAADVSEHVHH